MSRTLSGLFLVGADNRPRKRKRTNRENPRRVPGQIGKIPGKVPKGQKRTKKEGQVQIGKPPRLKHPRLAALEKVAHLCFGLVRIKVPLLTCSSPRCAPSGGTKYVSFELFLSILRGPGEGRVGAPGTVPLQNPKVTSQKAIFEKC